MICISALDFTGIIMNTYCKTIRIYVICNVNQLYLFIHMFLTGKNVLLGILTYFIAEDEGPITIIPCIYYIYYDICTRLK